MYAKCANLIRDLDTDFLSSDCIDVCAPAVLSQTI